MHKQLVCYDCLDFRYAAVDVIEMRPHVGQSSSRSSCSGLLISNHGIVCFSSPVYHQLSLIRLYVLLGGFYFFSWISPCEVTGSNS